MLLNFLLCLGESLQQRIIQSKLPKLMRSGNPDQTGLFGPFDQMLLFLEVQIFSFSVFDLFLQSPNFFWSPSTFTASVPVGKCICHCWLWSYSSEPGKHTHYCDTVIFDSHTKRFPFLPSAFIPILFAFNKLTFVCFSLFWP